MRKLAIIALAAGAALIPLSAAAQQHGARPGVSWGGHGGGGQVVRHGGGGGQVIRHRDGNQRIVVRQRGNGNQRIVVRDGGQRIVVRNRGGGGHFQNRFPHITRIVRGHRVPHSWFGPQFHVRNWQVYGFPQPRQDWRWVRYYDDALLIDRSGTVHDGRYGFDWDQYGERWDMDERGIPAYAGDGDYRHGDEDYAEEESADWDRSEYGRGGGHHEERRGGHGGRYVEERGYGGGGHGGGGGYGGGHGGGYAPMPRAGHGGGASAYGYGASYGNATITETITETFVEAAAPTGYVEEVIEEVVETRRPRRVRRAPRPRCDCRPAQRPRVRHVPPPAGERG
jgi:Ni/Co efflux regulator RcnB